MRKMKDSGVQWIGQIPDNWQITINKTLLKNTSEKNHPHAEVLSLYRELGVVPKNSRDDNHNVTSENTTQYKFVECGDLVINKMKAWQGSLAVSNYEGIVSPAYYVCKFRSKSVNKAYVHYLLRSNVYAQQFECLSTGMRVGQWDLAIDDFLRTPLLLPPMKEQTEIVDFLNKKTVEINALIANVQEQIEKLKFYKQSVVREAVTRGLDPNAPMKESGIEWIGQIPCDWKVLASKWLMRKTKTIREKYSGESVLSLTTKGVITRDLDNPSGKMPATFDGYQFVEAGNLLMCLFDIDVTPRCIGLIKNDGVCSPAYSQFKLNGLADAEYYYYYYLSLDYTKELLHLAKNLRHSLTEEQFGAIPTVLPPMETQKEIAAYLNKKCADIDRVLEIKQSKIEKLEQYKRSLIYEYVTGKKEVS